MRQSVQDLRKRRASSRPSAPRGPAKRPPEKEPHEWPTNGEQIWTGLATGLLIALTLIVAYPALSNDIVDLDDSLYTTNQFASQGLTPPAVKFAFSAVTTLYWHPLTWLSHELDVQLFGANPAGHHFTSILLHALSAGLLFLVLRRMGVRSWASVAGALLWAVHPLRVESFAWIAERKDVLCAVFFLASTFDLSPLYRAPLNRPLRCVCRILRADPDVEAHRRLPPSDPQYPRLLATS